MLRETIAKSYTTFFALHSASMVIVVFVGLLIHAEIDDINRFPDPKRFAAKNGVHFRRHDCYDWNVKFSSS